MTTQTSTREHAPTSHPATRPGGARWWAILPPLDPALSRYWRDWAYSPDGARTVRHWSRYRELRGWTPEELAEPRGCSSADVNSMQLRLLYLSQAGCPIALATLLVQLRPGLTRLARSASTWPWTVAHGHREICAEVQGGFLETVFELDVERRRHRVAANLVNDTRQRLWRSSPVGWPSGSESPPSWQANWQTNWQLRSRSDMRGDAVCPDGTTALSTVETVLDLRRHLQSPTSGGTTPRDTSEMAYLAWVQEYPLSEIAERLGRSPGAVANRLHRLRTQLRAELAS